MTDEEIRRAAHVSVPAGRDAHASRSPGHFILHPSSFILSFLAAIRFLTILPLPGTWGAAAADLRRSVPFFPVVGLVIGALAGAAAYGLTFVLPPLVGAVVVVIVLAAASGCLHLDGLADTADGMLSSRPRERILEIMKDSHVGVMGVIAIVCVLLLKVTALASAPAGSWWRIAGLMPVAGRCTLVVVMAILPYARREGGLGSVFFDRRPRLAAVWALVVLGVTGWLVAGTAGLVAAGVAVVVALLLAVYTHRKIGGATGDTLGATCELAEAAIAVTCVAV